MCTGLEIAALVASAATAAAGAGVSASGARKSQDEATINNARIAQARNDELRKTLALNDKISAESRNAYKGVEDTLPDMPVKQDQLTAERTGQLEAAIPSEDASRIPLSGSAPSVVRSEAAKEMLDATDKAKQTAKALGKVGGYGDLFFDQGLNTQAAGRDVNEYQNFISGNMSLLPYLQDFAGYGAYRPSSGVGEVFQAAGNVLGAAAPSVGGAVQKRGGLMPAKSSGPVPVEPLK